MKEPGQRAPRPGYQWLRNNAVGLVALFVALSGTAVAAQVASDTQSNPAVKKAKKKKRGPRGLQGPQGPPGANGVNGKDGTNGTAIAFAAVNADGTLVSDSDIPGGNFNITQAQVSKTGTGLYCFKIPGVRSAVANVSDGNNGFPWGTATVAIGPDGLTCPGGQGFTVHIQTARETAGTLGDADLPFFVWFE